MKVWKSSTLVALRGSQRLLGGGLLALVSSLPAYGHGTAVSPISRVRQVYESNPENPSFPLAQNAVAVDGSLSYYTWNEVSRNIPAAVEAGLPAGFDYSPWVPDGQLASGGRVDPGSTEYPRTYAGLDQPSANWPTTPVAAGEALQVDFLATAVHEPSVWDVWMTTSDWDPDSPLNWGQMEFLGRPNPVLDGMHYSFEVDVPAGRSGHHVLWIAWHRDDPVGEVFFSTSDLLVAAAASPADFDEDGDVDGDDFLNWQGGFPTAGGAVPADGDADRDGDVDGDDFLIWQNEFGSGFGAGQVALPEPVAAILAVIAGAAACLGRVRV